MSRGTETLVGLTSLVLACVSCSAYQSDPLNPADQIVQVNDAREELCAGWRGGGRLLVAPGPERDAGDAACRLTCEAVEE